MAHRKPTLIFFSERVIAIWGDEVANWYQRETGGMLFGFETVAGQLVITDASGPGPAAHRGWFSFEPDDDWDKQVISEIYIASGRVIRYLGEWHSHRFGMMRPSRDDLRTMRLVAAYEPARIRNPVCAIVSPRPGGSIKWSVYLLNDAGDLESVSPSLIPSASVE